MLAGSGVVESFVVPEIRNELELVERAGTAAPPNSLRGCAAVGATNRIVPTLRVGRDSEVQLVLPARLAHRNRRKRPRLARRSVGQRIRRTTAPEALNSRSVGTTAFILAVNEVLTVFPLVTTTWNSRASARKPQLLTSGLKLIGCWRFASKNTYLTEIVTPERLATVPIVKVTGTDAPVAASCGTVRLICINPTNPGAEAAYPRVAAAPPTVSVAGDSAGAAYAGAGTPVTPAGLR